MRFLNRPPSFCGKQHVYSFQYLTKLKKFKEKFKKGAPQYFEAKKPFFSHFLLSDSLFLT
jgi:hypothetical protein